MAVVVALILPLVVAVTYVIGAQTSISAGTGTRIVTAGVPYHPQGCLLAKTATGNELNASD